MELKKKEYYYFICIKCGENGVNFYCAKTGRNICLVGRSMQRIYKAARKCGYLQGLIEPLDPRDAKKVPKNKVLYLNRQPR